MRNDRRNGSGHFAPARGSRAVLPWIVLAWLLGGALAAFAQDAPLKVSVNGRILLVNGEAITPQDATGPIDTLTSRKASLAAHVLDEQILHSDFAARLFSPAVRAAVLSDLASGRLVEPWQRALGMDGNATDAALASATENFKTWATKLAAEPREMTLAIARKTYLEGIPAYQENAAIYRSVMVRHEPLSFDSAQRFLQNQMATRRLAVAVELEKYVNANTAPAAGAADPDELRTLRQRLQSEVLDRVSGAATSAAGLERSYTAMARIAEGQSAPLRSYLGTVKPAEIRFTFTGGKGGAAAPAPSPSPGMIVTRFAGQNAVTISVPVTPPKNPPFNITGGILPPPAGYTAGSPAGGGNRAAASPSGPGTGAGANAGGSAAAGNNGSAAGGATSSGGTSGGDQATTPAPADSQLANNSDRGSAVPGDFDNLRTYSSKPYHSADSKVFNPMNGMWENPADPADYRIPTVITCCDSTGLAFPDDALEAQQDYWWGDGSGVGTDPNCGRLYSCGPVVDPAPVATSPPSDRDNEILKAIAYLDQFPPDQKGPAFANFLTSLDPLIRNRAIELLRQYNTGHAGAAAAARPRPTAQAVRNAPSTSYAYSGRSGGNNSTITGVGNSGGGGLRSSYQPITQNAAQSIVGQYKSIPGGVTLEGSSPDLGFVKTISYLPKANAFLLNNDIVYLNPVSAADFAEIQRAIASDDKMGVSLSWQAAIVYGKLAPQGDVAGNLELADRFLGDIAFGQQRVTKGYVFAPGYEPKPATVGGNIAVYFNIHDIRFREAADGHIARSGVNVDTTLVPLTAAAGSDGGHLPDLDRVKNGNIPPEYVANLQHLQNNIDYYGRERIVRKALAYGEAAAFARTLKASGVTFDLASLGEGVAAEKRNEGAPAASSGGESCALAALHWTSTESIGTREAYRDHLARFPNCAFATLATARIASIDAKAEPAPAVMPHAREPVHREPPPKRVVARRATPSAAPAASSGTLDCNGPIALVGCVSHALSKH